MRSPRPRVSRPGEPRADLNGGTCPASLCFGFGSTVFVTCSRSGRSSSNWTSDGSPASAAAATWYQPGNAHFVSFEHSSSERLASHVTLTLVVWSRRRVTSSPRTARGQCRLVQISSSPEVTLRVSVSGETSQVQASETIVRSSRTMRTSRPATGSSTVGVTATSSSSQVPSGSASGTTSFFFFFSDRRFPDSVAVGEGSGSARVVVGAAATCLACSRASGCDDASLPAPRARAIPNTRSTAVPSTISRRTQ